MKQKTLKLPKDNIYLVAHIVKFEGYDVLAAFKTKNAAQKFVDACKKMFEKDKDTELHFGEHTIDKYDIDKIKILGSCWTTDSAEVPFFNK